MKQKETNHALTSAYIEYLRSRIVQPKEPAKGPIDDAVGYGERRGREAAIEAVKDLTQNDELCLT